MLYLDTSLLVTALTIEENTPVVRAWLRQQISTQLCISDWTITEFSSAIAIKYRHGKIGTSERAQVLTLFSQWTAESFKIFPISSHHFTTAAHYVNQYSLALRGGDALHLAVAAERGATLCTRDKRLADAGEPLGISTLLI